MLENQIVLANLPVQSESPFQFVKRLSILKTTKYTAIKYTSVKKHKGIYSFSEVDLWIWDIDQFNLKVSNWNGSIELTKESIRTSSLAFTDYMMPACSITPKW